MFTCIVSPLFVQLSHLIALLSSINPRSYFKPVTLLGRPTNIREGERERPCEGSPAHINNERGRVCKNEAGGRGYEGC